MNTIYFECLNPQPENEGFFRVPDQTLVNPFLNPNDAMSRLPPGLFNGMAIAAGQINPGVKSNIAVAPYIYEVTLLLEGELRIHQYCCCSAAPPRNWPFLEPGPVLPCGARIGES